MIASIVAFVAGTVVPLLVYRRTGWWLNSADGVALQTGLLFAVGLVVSLFPRRDASPFTWWLPAIAADTAAIATSTAILLHDGAGTLFPIVLVFVQGICTGAIFIGAAVAILPRLRRRRGEPRPRA